jgi:hypothetical protein
MHLDIQFAGRDDFAALEQLLELYQYDLSDIWPQDIDVSARYGFDLTRHRRAERSRAYIARSGAQYVGLALVAPAIVTRTEGSWMEQFFILKRYRRTGPAGRWPDMCCSATPACVCRFDMRLRGDEIKTANFRSGSIFAPDCRRPGA